MTFIAEKPVRAVRKRHVCEGCDNWIEIGEAAVNWCGVADGQFSSMYYHPECREAEVALNNLIDWRCGDDWSRLCEADHEHHPWIKAEYPIAYKRMMMTREQWANHCKAIA